VCLLTEETTAVGLGEAIEAVAGGEPLETVAARVTRALEGHPVVAVPAFVIPTENGFVGFGPHTVPAAVYRTNPAVHDAVTSGVRMLFPDLDGLVPHVADACRDAGYRALWIEPVLTADRPSPGALVLGRRQPGNPSPNQLNSIHQAAAILAVGYKLG
jgi:hypothetical protein